MSITELHLPKGGKAFNSIRDSTARINIWDGAVRSGKSWASIVRWMEYVRNVPPQYQLMMVGKTERTLYRNIITVMQDLAGHDNVVFNQGRSELTVFGRTVFTASGNDESSQDKIRGITLAGMYGDEISLWPESFYKMALSRLSVKGAKAFFTTNPDGPYHFLKQEYIDRIDELNTPETPNMLRYFHFTMDDNPTLDPLYVASLKKEYTGVFYQRFIEGLWVQAEGAVYDMWDENLHVTKDTKNYRHYSVGVDYGTNNPCAFVMIGYDSMNGPYHIVKEYFYDGRNSGGMQKTDAKYADDLANFMNGYRVSAIYVDPSALSFMTELRQRGIIPTQANNKVLDGIRFVGSCLAGRKLMVDASCKNVIKEFGAYVWDDKAQRMGEDKPVKEHDHTLDAIRYALFTNFGAGRSGIIGGFKF